MSIIGQTFDQLVNKTDEQALDEAKLLAKRQLQRKIASAHDDAYTSELKIQHHINEMFSGFRTAPANAANKFDVNELVRLRADLRQYQQARADCAELYRELFGEDIPALA